MSERSLAALKTWVAAPIDGDVADAIERLRRAPDVQRVAVMPDIHLAVDVCVGVAVATSRLIYPQAVGGDIGCGVLAVPFDLDAACLNNPARAGQVLAQLGRSLPARRRNRSAAIPLPDDLAAAALSDAKLETLRRTEGALAFATLGSGNHFAELQADEAGRLWLMVHSGSRALGPAIRDHHLARAEPVGSGLKALDASGEQGSAYLRDAAWARRYADASRRQMALCFGEVVSAILGGKLQWAEALATDHNHVELEEHGAATFWVHRKGAMPARYGQDGALPGSMGSASFHVQGRGCVDALCSSAHGAGRLMSRTEARKRVTERDLRRQMSGVWYDHRQSDKLRDEAPTAYKDIRAVLRAQHELVKVIRVLRPLLNYKGT